MYCRTCKTKYPNNASYCPACGQPLIDDLNWYGLEFYEGNQDAYKKIYDNTERWVRNEVIKKGIISAEIDDCLQEIYLHVYTKIAAFDPSKGDFRPWFNTVVKNKLEDYSRSRRKQWQTEMSLYSKPSEDDDNYLDMLDQMESTGFITPELAADQAETSRLVNEILDELTDSQKACILLRYKEELKQKEIAEQLGVPIGTVKSCLSHGLKKVEKKVLELEKRGTKLYSIAPVPFFLCLLSEIDFSGKPREEVWNAVQSQIPSSHIASESTVHKAAGKIARHEMTKKSVENSISKGGGVSTVGGAAKTAAVGVTKGIGTKVVIGIIIVVIAVGSGIAGINYARLRNTDVQEEIDGEDQVTADEDNKRNENESPDKEAVDIADLEETIESEDEDFPEIYKLYAAKLDEIEAEYGVEEVSGDGSWIFYKGLCYAELIDFDNNGEEELILAYRNMEWDELERYFTIEVWAYKGDSIERVYSNNASLEVGEISVDVAEIDGLKYILSSNTYDDTSYSKKLYSYDGTMFQEVYSLNGI